MIVLIVCLLVIVLNSLRIGISDTDYKPIVLSENEWDMTENPSGTYDFKFKFDLDGDTYKSSLTDVPVNTLNKSPGYNPFSTDLTVWIDYDNPKDLYLTPNPTYFKITEQIGFVSILTALIMLFMLLWDKVIKNYLDEGNKTEVKETKIEKRIYTDGSRVNSTMKR